MKIKEIKKFCADFSKNEILRNEIVKLKNKCLKKLSFNQAVQFVKTDLIPLAKEYGYIFTAEDYLSYIGKENIEKLDEKELFAITGGRKNLKLKTFSLVASLLLLGSEINLISDVNKDNKKSSLNAPTGLNQEQYEYLRDFYYLRKGHKNFSTNKSKVNFSLEKIKEENRKLKQKNEELVKENKGLKFELKYNGEDKLKLNKKDSLIKKLRNEIESLKIELKESNDKVKQLEQEVSKLKKDIQELKNQVIAKENIVLQLNDEKKNLSKQIKQLTTQQLDVANQEKIRLTQQLDVANQQLDVANQEKIRLTQQLD
ncbi:MAG: hypothetical protein LBT82_01910, partial [Oscillospiraceae bacterium]|nr:hypothetical protein [Oscillospiraceae bacterium]